MNDSTCITNRISLQNEARKQATSIKSLVPILPLQLHGTLLHLGGDNFSCRATQINRNPALKKALRFAERALRFSVRRFCFLACWKMVEVQWVLISTVFIQGLFWDVKPTVHTEGLELEGCLGVVMWSCKVHIWGSFLNGHYKWHWHMQMEVIMRWFSQIRTSSAPQDYHLLSQYPLMDSLP